MKEYGVIKISDDLNGPESIDWKSIPALNDFSYPWMPGEKASMNFRACWNNGQFMFRFAVNNNNILVYHNIDKKEEVMLSDRVEIFFKKNDSLSPYYCLEMDPDGRTLDYEAHYYRKFIRDWHWPSGQFQIKTGKDSKRYYVQGSIGIESLKNLGLWNGGKVQAGLYRGHCISLIEKDAVLTWISWVDPKTKEPDFHVASSFGILNFER